MKKPKSQSRSAPGSHPPLTPATDKGSTPPGEGDNGPDILLASNHPLTPSQRKSLHDFILEEAKRLPDIRQDRVNQIRTALKAGNYRIASDLIADRILQDTIVDNSSNQE